MRFLELSMPLDYERMPDEIFPTATPFILAPTILGPARRPDKGITLGTETGTCLTLPSQFTEYRKTTRLHEVAIEKLVLRETVVVDLPTEEGGEISPDDIEAALTGVEFHSGDAVLLRTGWGDEDRHQRPGAGYMLGTPHFSVEGAAYLARKMQERSSDLLLTDMALIGLPEKHLIPEWRPLTSAAEPWPSPRAEGYLRTYTPEKMADDYAAAIALAGAGIMTVKRLVNCGAIQSSRIRIIVGPLKLVRGIGSPCRVVAAED
jgi:kynurenine formamidase